MNRRKVILVLLSTGMATLGAIAQTELRVWPIGFLGLGSAHGNAAYLPAFRAGTLELRWLEGRDYVIDARFASGVVQALPALADELMATQPHLLLTPADGTVRLLAQRTKTIPIVFALSQDSVGGGIGASLRRPGGNATGLTTLSTELLAKRPQLLKEAFPRVAHVAQLFEPDNVGSVSAAAACIIAGATGSSVDCKRALVGIALEIAATA